MQGQSLEPSLGDKTNHLAYALSEYSDQTVYAFTMFRACATLEAKKQCFLQVDSEYFSNNGRTARLI